jgi:hypothetical protein
MDAVYPYHVPKGLFWGQEIHYSIKCLRKFTDIKNIYAVGDYTDVAIHIPYAQTQTPAVNIWEKCLIACGDERISDPFLFISDDTYFIKETDVSNYPNYAHGTIGGHPRLNEVIQIGGSKFLEAYAALIKKTYELLGDVVFFNVHTPVLIHKQKFIDCYRKYEDELYKSQKHSDGSFHSLGLLLKTTYLQGADFEMTTDYKAHKSISRQQLEKDLKDRHVFSTGDEVSPGTMEYLASL